MDPDPGVPKNIWVLRIRIRSTALLVAAVENEVEGREHWHYCCPDCLSQSHVLHPGSAAKNWYFDNSGERKSICFDMTVHNDRLEVPVANFNYLSRRSLVFFGGKGAENNFIQCCASEIFIFLNFICHVNDESLFGLYVRYIL